MELHSQLPGSHLLTAPVCPPKRVTGPPELHHSEGRYPWFGLITQRAIRRGSFSSVKELIAKIEQFVEPYNKTKAPFNWTATSDSILEKLQRLCLQISGTGH